MSDVHWPHFRAGEHLHPLMWDPYPYVSWRITGTEFFPTKTTI